MINPIVRRYSELPRIPADGEPMHWMPWDPFYGPVPFVTAEEEPARFIPDFEIKETEDGFVFKADVPGTQEKDLSITVTGNRLTISGRREAEEEANEDIYYARERPYGAFTRAFTLPDGTDGSNHSRAELNRGVLTLLVPKLQPKRIEVKVAEKS